MHLPDPSRRRFLKTFATAAGAPLILRGYLSAASPNGKLNHAAVGVGGQGWGDLAQIASHPDVHVAAICDVDSAHMGQAVEAFPDARRYQDWREMLDVEGDRIDSVQVAVPDHMHAPISIAAMERGKHVYCEKPLTHQVAEARAMRLAAEKAGVVTQMGNQIQSALEYRTAVALIQEGVIGKIKELHAWSGAVYTGRGRPEGEDPLPDSLAWDQWLGVAPARPYKQGAYHPFHWRGWQDFGTGPMGDFGCHILDTPFKALELTAPTTFRATVPDEWAANEDWNTENWPEWEVVEYAFPGTKWTTGDIKVTWHDGGKQPSRDTAGFEDDQRNLPGSGSLFVGEGGNLLLPHVGNPELLPRSQHQGVARPQLEGRNHYHSFVEACLGRDETTSHFGFAGPLAEAVLLGNVASRQHGQELHWDSATLKVTNSEAADKLLRRSYREFA